MLNYLIKGKEDKKDFIVNDLKFNDVNYEWAVSKKCTIDLPKVKAALVKLKGNGKIQAIMNKYK